ncbi:tetratricopeptide repeat protein [Hyphomicrobium sp.]|jgi:Flp pilus assembly protein TadD|uniref:tetratricopeptide repeat protein n=1 Tax=Hyphomicrobium sp. TaxID=82 RepID=UPI0035627108
MQEATEKSVLGNFDGATFSKDGVESTLFKKNGKFWVRTDGPDGKIADFEVRYTFGVAPLQQYLIELSGGRLQALGIAWDARPKEAGGQRWYSLYPNRKLVSGDPLHWTGIDQNWNYQCAWCHSTNLQKNYDRSTATFKTAWSEISVGCEACHGPASKHMEWAKSNGTLTYDHAGFAFSLDDRKGASWPMAANGQAERSTPRITDKEIKACAGCHARRQQFSSDPKSVNRLFDAFRPTTLDADAYYPDGQQRDEVYTYGSFLQSRMYAAGVTCSDCHNTHSGKLRFAGNTVCTQCHAAERFDTTMHHHHPIGSDSSKCVSCHMPTTTYLGVDARHDHSLRIPRPDPSIVLGTPNACNRCHTDKSAKWAKEAVESWYHSLNPGAQDFAEAFSLGDLGAPGAQEALEHIALAASSSGIAKASALTRLARFQSPHVLDLAAKSLKIDDAAVRSAAVAIIAGADATTRRTLLIPLLADASALVRIDAARALAGAPEAGLSPDDRKAFDRALAEYVDAQLFNAERPESLTNLGSLYRDRGQLNDARQALEQAIAIDPTFVAAAISLSDLVRMNGDESSAEAILRRTLAANPNSGPVEHALGLSLVRQKHADGAISLLAKAAADSPDDPRFSYVLAVALHDTGKRVDAMRTLKAALSRHPYDRDILYALASYDIETGDYESALQTVELLRSLEPERPDVAQFLSSLRQMVPKGDRAP